MDRVLLQRYLDELLDTARFKDYCPNGLQVEGAPEVAKVLCGVTASMALIEAAIESGANTILVHHGWFWRGEDSRVTGLRRARLASLLANDINLLAYHLPLDAHPELGNNAQLGKVLGFKPTGARASRGCFGWAHRTARSPPLKSVRMRAGSFRASPYWSETRIESSGVSRGAPAVRRACSNRPSRRAPMHTFPVRFPSRRPTLRVSPGCPTSQRVIMRRNGTACVRWVLTWPDVSD